ncbi:MAG: hypothetical protein PHS97_01290 [Oscillospiraceae bacterium]|nr:hypothetical protein [Oscillospiraceae bacterium]
MLDCFDSTPIFLRKSLLQWVFAHFSLFREIRTLKTIIVKTGIEKMHRVYFSTGYIQITAADIPSRGVSANGIRCCGAAAGVIGFSDIFDLAPLSSNG